MPELLWLYLTALLYDRTSARCVAVAEALTTVSHDRLTRLLQAAWSGPTLLELAVRTLFVWERGYLMMDDTVIPTPFATAIADRGWLSGGLNVLVVRDGAKYDATNRLMLPAAEGRRLYRFRSQIEAVIRVCKDQRSLTGCQARSERAQRHHITCCWGAFCVLERERHERQLSIYKLKRQLSFRGRSFVLPALERLRSAA